MFANLLPEEPNTLNKLVELQLRSKFVQLKDSLLVYSPTSHLNGHYGSVATFKGFGCNNPHWLYRHNGISGSE